VTVQTILRFPDRHLRATAQRVVVFDEDLCSLATDLLDTLRAASAIGITATHIGVLKRLTVIELAAADGVRTYVNPQIVWASADMIRHEEGTVSMPGVTEEIVRHARVRMSYQDLSGVEKVEEADGLLRCTFSAHWASRLVPCLTTVPRFASRRNTVSARAATTSLNAASPEGISFACMTAPAISADVSGTDAVRRAFCVSLDSSLRAKYRVRR